MKMAILGAGAFGTALGGILADNGYDIDYYDSKLEKEKLTDVVDNAKYVVLCVPSKAAPYLLPYLPKEKSLIVATKGILSDAVFDDFDDMMVLSGPGFADDIKAHKDVSLTITDDRLEKIFEADYINFDKTDDKNGVLMCGALKNVYAIEAGFRDLERDSIKWRQFIKDAVTEMKAILGENGAKPETVSLVCGIDDLKLTCGYPSRNFEFGKKLRADSKYQAEKTVEGLSALRRISRGEIKVPEGVPILKELLERFR